MRRVIVTVSGAIRIAACMLALAALSPAIAIAQDDEVAPPGNIRLPAPEPKGLNGEGTAPADNVEAPAPALGLPLPPEPVLTPAPVTAPAPEKPAQPSAAVLPLTPSNQDIPLPPLPPSRPCAAKDVTGVWRLINVYERPAATEQAAFARARFQYMQFAFNSVLTTYTSPNNDLTLAQIQDKLNVQDDDNLQQYVFRSGYIYFYSKGAATNNMACFIVANAKAPFAVGQMLLMPPKEQSVGRRLVKVYEQAVLPSVAAPAAAPAPPANNGRRRTRAGTPPATPTANNP